ncbi:MAG: NAD(P)H-quinone oxidoreductase [Candidatus Eremiobacteraeota bacterium]|nr:NAD(P)H-quinone oxidoreductase [Candidatus Eremiobacteraeota bacterium]
MRAVVLEQSGGPEVLVVRDGVEPPEPQGEDVRVRVRAFGINRADLLQRRGRYPAPPDAYDPRIPGLEYAGEIEKLGPRARERKLGERVFGICAGGAYAEFLCVHERTTVRMPQGLSFEDAAAMPEAFMTAFDALEQGGFAPGGSALIHAVGSGVGTAAAQLVATAGGTAIGTSRTAAKLERARAFGMSAGALADEAWEDVARSATGGRGVDVVLDFVGASTFARNFAAIRTGGRVIQIGTLGSSKGEVDLGVVMAKRAAFIGTVLRSRPLEEKIAIARAFERLVVPRIAEGVLRPVVDEVFDFERVSDAHRAMEDNRNFGKLVVRV